MYSNKYDKIVGQWTGKSYIMLKRLGTGGIGEIYLVQDSEGRLLALKLSTDMISITKEYNFLKRFQNKAYVPKVYDLDDYVKHENIYHYFTMEYIVGYNLKTAMKEKSISLKTKLNLMCIITTIIKQLNDENYVYTDLKHENIMVDGQNKQIKLIDFGSLVQLGSSVKEFTPMYDRLCWGKGKRVAEISYQIFALAMLFLSLALNRNLDPDKEKLEAAIGNLRKRRLPRSFLNIIVKSLDGQIRDCDALYNEISCAAEEYEPPNKISLVLNIVIGALASLLIVTIFAFIG